MLPQIVVCRALRLDVHKVGPARARMARGAHAQREEAVVRHVVRVLAKQRGAELRPKSASVRPSLFAPGLGPTHLVAEAGVAAADALLVAGAHGELHDAVEARCAGLAGGRAGGVGVVLEVGRRGAADVRVAAVGVLTDRVGGVEGEEGERRA